MEGMDELLNATYTAEQAEQDRETQEELLLPEGNYRTLPALSLTARVSDRAMVTDRDGKERGRIQYRFFAQVQNETDGAKGGLGFTISPDRVRGQSGRPDGQSTLWTQAVNAFTHANGRQPSTNMEVAEYIRDYPVRLRIGKLAGNERFPDPANFVRSLSAVRD